MTKRCAQGHPGKHRQSHLVGGGDMQRMVAILTPGSCDGGTCGEAPQPHPPLMQMAKSPSFPWLRKPGEMKWKIHLTGKEVEN